MGWWSWVKDIAVGVESAVGTIALTAIIGTLSILPALIVLAVCVVVIAIVVVVDIYFNPENETSQPNFPNTALAGEFCYHASIHFNNQHYCSGVFIGTYFILTLGQCVHTFVNNRVDMAKLKVFIGIREVPVETEIGYAIDKITLHPNFKERRLSYNAAVLKMTTLINQYKRECSITLPSPPMNILKTTVDVSGFRCSAASGVITGMTKTNMIIIENHICRSHFYSKVETSGKFCAIPSRHWKPCQSSLGGPAANSDKILVGLFILENFQGCAKDLPELFLYVPRYIDFIRNATKSDDENGGDDNIIF